MAHTPSPDGDLTGMDVERLLKEVAYCQTKLRKLEEIRLRRDRAYRALLAKGVTRVRIGAAAGVTPAAVLYQVNKLNRDEGKAPAT